MRAELSPKRSFEFELSEESFDSKLELRVVGDRLSQVRAAHFLSFLGAKRSHEKVAPVVLGPGAHAQVQLEIGNKSSDLVAGRLTEARSARELE